MIYDSVLRTVIFPNSLIPILHNHIKHLYIIRLSQIKGFEFFTWSLRDASLDYTQLTCNEKENKNDKY